jgi:hypothetical protein
MKKYQKPLISTLIIILLVSTILTAQGVAESGYLDIETTIDNVEEVQESSALEDGILLMREEEKLARDVYLALYDTWGLRTFGNIAQAEQQHMDSVAYLLDMNSIADPAEGSDVGVFKNEEIATLYTSLVERGSTSIVEALKVGALIEDLDIADLERLLSETTDADAIRVYENLLRGSENHMRAFINQLSRYNQNYDPIYISDLRYNEIIGRN